MRPDQWLAPLMSSRLGRLPLVDVIVAAVLSGYVVLITCGVDNANPNARPWAAVVAVTLTVPVAYRRPAPLAAAATVALASIVNAVLIGDLVRCGAALPAVFCVAYAVGTDGPDADDEAEARQRRRAALGVCLCAVNVIVQCLTDPQLGPLVAIYMVPIALLFFALGRVVRSWTCAAESLRRVSVGIERQRVETARLAVEADRAVLSADLEHAVAARIDAVALLVKAESARTLPDVDRSLAALACIERDGRQILDEMRRVVLLLGTWAPNEPQPGLSQLSTLVADTCGSEATLTVAGSPRPLANVIELSGYRIVEHLLASFDRPRGDRVEVRLTYAPDRLDIEVTGPTSRDDVDLAASVAAARERLALYGGSLDRARGGAWLARLPLVTADG